MIDIENIIEDQSLTENGENGKKKERFIIKNKKRLPEESTTENDDDLQIDKSHLPGYQKIYLKTWGCSHNTSEGEYMAGILEKYGYKIVQDPKEADLWILNSCTVKNPSEDAMRNMINKAIFNSDQDDKTKQLSKSEKEKYRQIPVVVTGCVPKADKKMKFQKGISVLASDEIERIVEVVEETLKGNLLFQHLYYSYKLISTNIQNNITYFE